MRREPGGRLNNRVHLYELVVCIHTCTLVVCIICILCIVGRRVVCVLSMPSIHTLVLE